jgi:hypothetical protein
LPLVRVVEGMTELPHQSDAEPVISGRGLAYWPRIATENGVAIDVYESSAADAPHIWLSLTDFISGRTRSVSVVSHMTVDQARAARDALTAAIDRAEQHG